MKSGISEGELCPLNFKSCPLITDTNTNLNMTHSQETHIIWIKIQLKYCKQFTGLN